MSAVYNYSLSGDFTSGAKAQQLHSEVLAEAGITTALEGIHIDEDADTVDIYFTVAISPAEETLLDGVVAAHTPINDIEVSFSDGQILVSVDDTTAGYLITKTVAGSGITLTELNNGGDEDLQISANNTSNIWNANQIQNIPVNATGITDDDYLIYNSTSAQFETRKAGSGISGITSFIPATNKFSFGNYGCQKIASNGSDTFHFIIPNQFVSVNSVKLIYFSDSTVSAGKTADISSSYGTVGENITANNESDTITFPTGLANIHRELDVSSVFTNLGPNDICGLLVNIHNIGSTIYVIGISINYNS